MNRKLSCVLIVLAVIIPVAVLAAYTDEIILHVDTGNLIQNGDGYQVVSDEGYYIPITYPPQTLYNDNVNLRDGLVAYWNMDETSGVRYDSHWSANLTDNNTVGYTSTGKIGNAAYAVVGSNEYLSHSSTFTGSIYTLFGWVNATNNAYPMVIQTAYDTLIVYYLSNQIHVVFGDGDSCDTDNSVSMPIAMGAWTLITVEHDRANETITLWVNGNSSTFDVSECDQPTSVEANIKFQGTAYIDEVGIYSRELTTDEISTLYNDGAGLSYDDFAPSYDLNDVTDLISGNTTWSTRILWTPAHSATVDWPTSGATLFDARGASDTERVSLAFDETDDAYHVYINGADRLTSPAQTFTAGAEQDVIFSLSFNADEYALYVNGEITDTDTTILGSPGISDWWVGRQYSGTTTGNATYTEFTVFDEYLDPVDVAEIYGQSLTRQASGGVEDLTDDLVSYWQLEETSGARADAWGDNDLTDNNTVTYATGVISNAAQMDAANAEYLSHVSNASLDTGNIDFTVFGFAYMDTLTNTGIIERSGEYSLRYDTTIGRFAFAVNDTTCSTATTVYATGSPVVTGTWYGVVGWHDTSGYIGIRVNHDEYMITYVDGVCDSSNTGNLFWVGRSDAGYHDGRLDEVAFWKRVLNVTERLYIVKGYFNDMRIEGTAENPSIQLPFVARDHEPETPETTPTPFPYASPTPDSPFVGIDYSGDTSWSDWAEKIESFFAPIFINISAAKDGVEELRVDVCGAGFSEGAGFLPGDQYDYATEAGMGEDPTVLDVAYSFGMAMGRPFAWIRSIYKWLPEVNSQYNIGGINFFVMLMYFLTGGIVWIVFVIVVTYSMYFIRSVIDFAIKIYELIPFKST